MLFSSENRIMHLSMPFSPENGIDDIICFFMLFSREDRMAISSHAVFF